jgi:hypothetical protein
MLPGVIQKFGFALMIALCPVIVSRRAWFLLARNPLVEDHSYFTGAASTLLKAKSDASAMKAMGPWLNF